MRRREGIVFTLITTIAFVASEQNSVGKREFISLWCLSGDGGGVVALLWWLVVVGVVVGRCGGSLWWVVLVGGW